jgi:cell division protein FtsI/penicillin-binding protein 2
MISAPSLGLKNASVIDKLKFVGQKSIQMSPRYLIFLILAVALSGVTQHAQAQSPCAAAIAQRTVCDSANNRALALMNAGNFEAFAVVQDVRTGALIAFAASQPAQLSITTPVLPLSVAKVFLAASWWDNHQPDIKFEVVRPKAIERVSVHEMIVGGSDSAGRQAAIALRKAVGSQTVMADLQRYGLGVDGTSAFWKDLSPRVRATLSPTESSLLLTPQMSDAEWADNLSIGEANMTVNGIHISRFLQAIGNGGLMLPQVAPEIAQRETKQIKAVRIMQPATARRLQLAMRDAVQRGSATSIAKSLNDVGWTMGGKTGTGPGTIGPQSDGWFAGLAFDQKGKARYTVATYVRRGGRGGGNAAMISAQLIRYIVK